MVPKLVIRLQTADEEFDYLWFLLEKVQFYKENGYSVSFPDNPEIQALVENPKTLKGANKNELRQLFKQDIYDPNFFTEGLKALNVERDIIVGVFSDLQSFKVQWGFKLFPEYQIRLTRYGPGGNYNSKKGVVKILTRKDGSFKRLHPAHLAVHEITHIGIEDCIVKKYKLTHWEKERIVDRICSLRFSHLLPGYEIQDKGEKAIDPFVTYETIDDLSKAIKKYVKIYPRG